MKLLSPQEAADFIGVHVNSIYKWIETGDLKATKFGDLWRIDQADIEAKVKGNHKSEE